MNDFACDRPTVPAPRSTEERTYEAVRKGEISIAEAIQRVEASRMEASRSRKAAA